MPRPSTAASRPITTNESGSECEVYATPIHIIHALLLALGVLAIALSGELIFGSARVFWLAGVLATGSLSAEADLFSFIMTESLTIVALFHLHAIRACWPGKRSRICGISRSPAYAWACCA